MPLLRLLVVPATLLALVATSAPAAHAALDPIASATGKDGGKRLKFVVALDGATAYLVMKIRRDGRFRTVDKAKLDCKYWDGSHDPGLDIQKADDQVLVTWLGPVEGEEYAEYAGYDVREGSVEAWGADGCPSQG